MIPNYERPESTITNNLAVSTPAAGNRFKAIFVGPRYRLNRFGQDTLPAGLAFNYNGQVVPFQYVDANGVTQALPATDIVDAASVALYGTGLEASIAAFNGGTADKFYLSDPSTPDILRISAGLVKGGNLAAELYGRAVQVGDVAYVNDGVSGVRRRTVIGLIGKTTASSFGTEGTDGHAGNSSYNPAATAVGFTSLAEPAGFAISCVSAATFSGLVRGSKLGNQYGDQFTIRVNQPGDCTHATFDISSASGLWYAVGVASADAGAHGGTAGDYYLANAELAGLVIEITHPRAVALGDAFTYQILGNYAQLPANAMALSGTYAGPANTTYMVQVTTGSVGGFTGAAVRISDIAGVDAIQSNVPITNDVNFAVGSYGLLMKFVLANITTQDGLRAGDIYFIQAVAAAPSAVDFDKIQLDGPAVNTSLFTDTGTALTLEFREVYSGAIAANAAADGSAWVASGTGITVDASLSLFDALRSAGHQWLPFADAIGTLTPSYRSLIPRDIGGDRVLCTTADDITAIAGVDDIDNDLAFAANTGLVGASGTPIYVLPIISNDLAGYNDALALIESTDEVYVVWLGTTDFNVMLAGKTHALAMGAKNVKNFRKVYVGTDSPGSYPVLQKKADGITNYLATIATHIGANTLVSTTDATVDFTTLGLAAGDRVLFPSLGTEYVLQSLIGPQELLLTAGPANPVAPAVPFQIWKADTVASQKAFLNARAIQLGTELVAHIWSEKPTVNINGIPTVIPARYLAAEMAGIRTALLPQQGTTFTEVTSVSAAPNMYLRYRSGDLDNIAANGTYIITQEAAGAPLFVRHQVTTQTGKGSLYYEDNATMVVHAVDFQSKDLIKPYLGKKNATLSVVSQIENDLTDMLRADTVAPQGLDANGNAIGIGPLIVSFRDLTVTLDPTLKDRIRTKGFFTVALPLNNVEIEWNAELLIS